MRRKKVFILLTIALLVCFASCSRKTNEAINESMISVFDQTGTQAVQNAGVSAEDVAGSSPDGTNIIYDANDITLADLPTERGDPEFLAGHVYLIGELPEHNIYLYGFLDPDEDIFNEWVILRINDVLNVYEWGFLTPRKIMPKMGYADFDHDGQEELAISFYIGSGTGYAVEDLCMIEINTDGTLTDMHLLPAEYIVYLEKNVSYSYNSECGIVSIKAGESIIEENDYIEDADSGKIEGLVFGDIVKFEFENNRIIGKFGIGLKFEHWASYPFVGKAFVDIEYTGSGFEMGDIVLGYD